MSDTSAPLVSSSALQATSGDTTGRLAGANGSPSRVVLFAVVAAALFMSAVDMAIVATALQAIQRGLHTTINWAAWTITIYGLGICLALPVAGKLSNQFGRRRVFLVGLALFTVSSLACGLSSNVFLLIVFRALQSFGGGTFQPSTAGLIADHFGKNRDRAIGLFGTMASAGLLAGPVIGGVLVGYLSWRWVFFVNVPIGVVLFIVVTKVIPESPRTGAKALDVRGLLLMAGFVLTFILGITNLGTGRTSLFDPTVVVPEACAVVLLVTFVRHTWRRDDGFIPMRLLRGKGFAVVNLQNFLIGVVAFGVVALIPYYAERRYHLSALSSGTLLTAHAVGFIAIGTAASFALRKTGYRLPMMVGFAIIATGLLVMSISPRWGLSPYTWLSIGGAIGGLGSGTVNPASRNASMQLAPEDVPSITGLRSMFAQLGSIMSVSIVTAILNRSANPGITQSHVLWVVAGIAVCVMIPLVSRIPEHKGAW